MPRIRSRCYARVDSLGTLINKFLDPEIDLSPAGIGNHALGTVFEELVRKLNEAASIWSTAERSAVLTGAGIARWTGGRHAVKYAPSPGLGSKREVAPETGHAFK